MVVHHQLQHQQQYRRHRNHPHEEDHEERESRPRTTTPRNVPNGRSKSPARRQPQPLPRTPTRTRRSPAPDDRRNISGRNRSSSGNNNNNSNRYPPPQPQSIDEDSYHAETAAQRLEMELRQRGYDPQTGGRLLQKESFSSNSDCDKYWQTPEQESRSMEEYYEGEEDSDDDDDDYTDYTDYTSVYTRQRQVDWDNHRRVEGPSKFANNGRKAPLPSSPAAARGPPTTAPLPQRRRHPQYSTSSSSTSSASSEEERSFISKLQDPRRRNPEHNTLRTGVRQQRIPLQGRRPTPTTVTKKQQRYGHDLSRDDRRDDVDVQEDIDDEEDPSIFQLHKRRPQQRLVVEERDPPPTKSPSSSAMTRPVNNTTTTTSTAVYHPHLSGRKNNSPTAAAHHHDMAGRIRQSSLSPPHDKNKRQTTRDKHHPQQEKKKKKDDNINAKSISDGTLPSNIVVEMDSDDVGDDAYGINQKKPKQPVQHQKQQQQQPKSHTSISKIMGKEYLFFQDDGKGDDTKSTKDLLTTVGPATMTAVPALTATPPVKKDNNDTKTRKQPAFLMNRPSNHIKNSKKNNNNKTLELVSEAGDIELQLSQCDFPTFYGTKIGSNVAPHQSAAATNTKKKNTNKKFLRNIIPGGKTKKQASETANDTAANTSNNDHDAECGLVSKNELVQQGWNPGDIADDYVVQPSADLSLFGRLIALRNEESARRNKNSRKHQEKEREAGEESTMERQETIESPETEDWEVLSHESDCLSDEYETKHCIAMVEEQQTDSATRRVESSASRATSEIHETPLVFQIPDLEDINPPKKNRGGLLGRVLSPRNKQQRSDKKPRAASVNDMYVSSVQASRGSAPSMSGWSASNASSTANSSDNQAATVVTGNLDTNRPPSKPIVSTNDNRESSQARKNDPPIDNEPSSSVLEATNEADTSHDMNEEREPSMENAPKELSKEVIQTKPSTGSNSSTTSLPKTAITKDNSAVAEKNAFNTVVEASSEKKSAVVQATTNPSTEIAPEPTLSKDSDDGIPIPSVSVQELRAMLESRPMENDVAEIAIEEKESNDDSIQAARSKRRMFGLPRVFQQEQEDIDSAPVMQQPNSDAGQLEKSYGSDEQRTKLDPPSNEDVENATWKTKASTDKSLADSVSIQSSLEGNSAANSLVSAKAAGFIDREDDNESIDRNEHVRSIEMEATLVPGSQESDAKLHRSSIPACGSIEDILAVASAMKKISTADRKNVRFADSLESFREIPPESSSTPSTYNDRKNRRLVDGTLEEDEKSKGGKKSILGWISARNRKRRSSQSRTDDSLSMISEEDDATDDDQQFHGAGKSVQHESISSRRIDSSVNQRHAEETQPRHQHQHETMKGDASSDESASDAADGIELIARRTKSGKNAILIAKSAKGGKVNRNATSNQAQATSRKVAIERAASPSRHRSQSPAKQQKGSVGFSLFKRGKSKRVKARTKRQVRNGDSGNVPKRRQVATKHQPRHSKNIIEEHDPFEMDPDSVGSSASSSMTSLARNGQTLAEPMHDRRDRRAGPVPLASLSEGDETPLTGSRSRTPSPQLAMEEASIPCSAADPSMPNAFNRDSSLPSRTSRASSAYSQQQAEPSMVDRELKTTHPTPKKAQVKAHAKEEGNKPEDDWFSWLLPGIFSPLPPQSQPSTTKPTLSLSDPTMIGSGHAMGRMSSHGTTTTKKSANSRYTNTSRTTVGSSAYYGGEDNYSQEDFTYSTAPSVASDDDQAVKSKRSVKKTKPNCTTTTTNTTSTTGTATANDVAPMEQEQIPVKQWQEILDATEVLAMSYKQQQKQQQGHPRDNDRTTSVADDDDDNTIDEVKRAIRKFREHAQRLGVQEKELMEAVRDDDRSVPSRKRNQQQQQKQRQQQLENQKTNGGGGVTDKFIEMVDYFFGPSGT